MVAITLSFVPFVAVNDGIFPVPLAASPMDGVLLFQAKVVPATGLLKLMAVVVAPLHQVGEVTGLTEVVG